MFDPREWTDDCTFRRIFLSERNDRLFAIVDPEDWERFAARSYSCHKQGGWVYPNFYARRTVWPTGTPFYLHAEILQAFAKPPTRHHTIADHINGNTLDNRRCNLRWATVKENRANRHSFWRKHNPETVWDHVEIC